MCPACKDKVLHTATEWVIFHPQAGHGYTKRAGLDWAVEHISGHFFRTVLPSSLIRTS